MTPTQCLQFILTLVITGMCTAGYGILFREQIASKKWLMWTGRALLAFHGIAFPVAFIILIWSVQ
jgi:hypothetical protein